MPRVVGIDHLVLTVGDFARSKAFYDKVLGFLGSESYSVQQMMIPDREGRYADDPQCAEPYASFRLRGCDGSVLPWPHLEGAHTH
jgi:catechol 2,3-dioxygenase-like lactoylglutathione lyase family enzyme